MASASSPLTPLLMLSKELISSGSGKAPSAPFLYFSITSVVSRTPCCAVKSASEYQSYIFHTIALRFFHMLHHDIGTNVSPLLYAELALKADGLQGYVDAMNEFN